MTVENIEPFLKMISYYESSSLNALILLMQGEHFDGICKEEAFLGARRLFARIESTLNHSSKGQRIDFTNESECEFVANLLMPFLLSKYQNDYEALNKYAETGAITKKQFNYELAFLKTYPRVFVKNICNRLTPFHELLLEYGTSENDLSVGLERLYRFLSRPMTFEQVVSTTEADIGRFLPPKLLDALVSANEMTDSPDSINAFSKKPYFPVVRENGAFHLLSAEELLDNFYKSLHRLFMKTSNQAERDALMREKGVNFNRMCANLFRFGLGFDSVYENMEYPDGEIDLMVFEKDCFFVIECKSRNYTDKISGPSTSFQKANQSNLDHASAQIDRFLKSFKKYGHARLTCKDGHTLQLHASDFKFVIPLVINLDNLAELNADYNSRNQHCAYVSYDDLTIIQLTIEKRKWLLVDFFDQLISDAKSDAAADDIIDMFAFYCQCKNLSILYQDKLRVMITELGNDYFRPYFSFSSETNPIKGFGTDVGTFEMIPNESFQQCITRYHEKYWKTIESFSDWVKQNAMRLP